MSLLKFILYVVIAFFVIRFLNRLLSPKRTQQINYYQDHQQHQQQQSAHPGNLEKPKFTIEAESVDYEIIEEPNQKNEK